MGVDLREGREDNCFDIKQKRNVYNYCLVLQKNVQIFIELRKGMRSLHELGRVIDVSGDCLGPRVSMADNKCLSS